MKDYTNYCTAEQTKRAYNLSAPLEYTLGGKDSVYCRKGNYNTYAYCLIPTTQQMLGWLREKGIEIQIHSYTLKNLGYIGYIYANVAYNTLNYNTYEQAELASIDAALDYLENEENK